MTRHSHSASHLADRALGAGLLPWSSVLNLLAGLYLAASGWIFAASIGRAGTVDTIAAGACIALIAAMRLAWGPDRAWISWFNALLGAWVIASPWIFHFADGTAAAWNVVVAGVTVVVLACLSETEPEATAVGRARHHHRTPGWDFPYDAPPSSAGQPPTRYDATYHDGTEGLGSLATRPAPAPPRPDEDIARDVRQGLALDPMLRAGSCSVHVRDGEVRLAGTVPTARAVRRAEEVCDAVDGVRGVANGLRVGEAAEPGG